MKQYKNTNKQTYKHGNETEQTSLAIYMKKSRNFQLLFHVRQAEDPLSIRQAMLSRFLFTPVN